VDKKSGHFSLLANTEEEKSRANDWQAYIMHAERRYCTQNRRHFETHHAQPQKNQKQIIVSTISVLKNMAKGYAKFLAVLS